MRLFRDAREAFRVAAAGLIANRTRGLLTTLGIIIGIVGVVTTMTAAHGLSNSFRESISALGSDVVYVSRMPWVVRGNWFEFRNRPNLSLKEARKLEQRLPGARAVNPTISTNRNVKVGSTVVRNANIIGTTDKHLTVSSSVPELGRFMTAFDVQFKRPVCIIGHEVRERLFEKVDPVGRTLLIGQHQFRVIGVMEKQGSAGFFGGPNFDSQIFVPITAFIRFFGGSHRDFNVAVKAPDPSLVRLEDFEYAVVGEMRKIRKLTPAQKDDFSLNKMDALVGMFNNVMGVVLAIGIVITGISLLVGGIGVMNIMFVSVTERTREIGVRKALGARRRVILAQFLLESSAICIAGGLVGLAAAYAATEAINRMLLPASISPGIVALALAVSLALGIIAGLVPAMRASRLDPIEALRYE